jgi:hypothetical protein
MDITFSRGNLNNYIAVVILFIFSLSFIVSNIPWLTIVLLVFWFIILRNKIYYFELNDEHFIIFFPINFLNTKLLVSQNEIEFILFDFSNKIFARSEDFMKVKLKNKKEYIVKIELDEENIKKINHLLDGGVWSNKIRIKEEKGIFKKK